jgi:hypothetical protein
MADATSRPNASGNLQYGKGKTTLKKEEELTRLTQEDLPDARYASADFKPVDSDGFRIGGETEADQPLKHRPAKAQT